MVEHKRLRRDERLANPPHMILKERDKRVIEAVYQYRVLMQQQIERLYLIALSRRPTADEVSALEKFLTRQQNRLAAESRPSVELALPIPFSDTADPYSAAALVDACLALLNTNEFIYVD